MKKGSIFHCQCGNEGEGRTKCSLHFVVILKYTEHGKQGRVCSGCRYKRWMDQQYTDPQHALQLDGRRKFKYVETAFSKFNF